jgi:hypothetical protein
MRVAAVAVLALLLAVPAGGRAGSATVGSNLLVALPSLGSVTWRCGADGNTWALGYREFWSSATTTVTLRAAGRLAARRTVDPHELVAFPLLRSPRQRLTFVQFTEPGRLRAVVRVDFRSHRRGYPNCAAYMPPRVTVDVYPRR